MSERPLNSVTLVQQFIFILVIIQFSNIHFRSYSVLVLDKRFILVVIHRLLSSYRCKHFTDINIVAVHYRL